LNRDRTLLLFSTQGECVSCLRGCLGARLLPQPYQYPNLSEGADRVGGQLRGDKECLFSGVTKGFLWTLSTMFTYLLRNQIWQSLEEGAGKRCSVEEGAGKRCSVEEGDAPTAHMTLSGSRTWKVKACCLKCDSPVSHFGGKLGFFSDRHDLHLHVRPWHRYSKIRPPYHSSTNQFYKT